MIIVDEIDLAIDKDNPAALNFMFQAIKRIRKYHVSIVITIQNLNDFTGSSDIKKKTTAMVNNTQYSLILNLAPQDLKDVTELYCSYGGLTLTERDYIARFMNVIVLILKLVKKSKKGFKNHKFLLKLNYIKNRVI